MTASLITSQIIHLTNNWCRSETEKILLEDLQQALLCWWECICDHLFVISSFANMSLGSRSNTTLQMSSICKEWLHPSPIPPLQMNLTLRDTYELVHRPLYGLFLFLYFKCRIFPNYLDFTNWKPSHKGRSNDNRNWVCFNHIFSLYWQIIKCTPG